MSQIWALTVLESTLMDRVANSTPMVDLDSRLNSLRVNRESTGPEEARRVGQLGNPNPPGGTSQATARTVTERGRRGDWGSVCGLGGMASRLTSFRRPSLQSAQPAAPRQHRALDHRLARADLEEVVVAAVSLQVRARSGEEHPTR